MSATFGEKPLDLIFSKNYDIDAEFEQVYKEITYLNPKQRRLVWNNFYMNNIWWLELCYMHIFE